MSDQSIRCTECGAEMELTEALTSQIREGLLAEVDEKSRKQNQEMAKKEKSLKKQLKEIENQKESLDDTVEERIQAEREKLAETAKKKAEKAFKVKTESLEEELREQAEKLSKSQKMEVNLRKEQRALAEREEALDLELEKKLSKERKIIRQKALEQASEEQQLKFREKEDLIESLKGKVGDLQRRIEVGSQESQGEALEDELLETLKSHFPFDEFEEVKKGAKGADVIQRVRNDTGKICGVILWESKNTKAFSNGWIDKLKKDQQRESADIAILRTVSLPKEIRDFDTVQDVWITNCASSMSLCTALRLTLIQVSRERLVNKHKEDMKGVIFDYITGPEFGRRIKGIVSAYARMQEDLDTEKRSMARMWKKRETQIKVVIDNCAEMYGEIEGLSSNQKLLESIEPLELN